MKKFPIAAAVALAFGASSSAALDCRPLLVTVDGRRLVGMEDIAVDAATGSIVLSAYDRWAAADRPEAAEGGLYRLDADKLSGDGTTVEAVDLTTGHAATPPMLPHGIDLFAGPDGSLRLIAVNRRPNAGTAVEEFELKQGMLRHRRTVEHPLLCRANDLAALDQNRFLFTSDHGACSWLGTMLENVLAPERGFVGLVDGHGVRVVAKGIGFANGILADPPNDRLYVAATRSGAVLVYRLSALLESAESVERPLARLPTEGGPDNLSRAPDGRILAAVHPSLLQLARHRYRWPGGATAPSRVVALHPSDGIERLLDHDGQLLSAATIAVAWNDDHRLLVGSVTDDHLLLCRDADPAGSTASPSRAPS